MGPESGLETFSIIVKIAWTRDTLMSGGRGHHPGSVGVTALLMTSFLKSANCSVCELRALQTIELPRFLIDTLSSQGC